MEEDGAAPTAAVEVKVSRRMGLFVNTFRKTGDELTKKQIVENQQQPAPAAGPTTTPTAASLPGPGPQLMLGSVQDEELKKLLMSWYYAGTLACTFRWTKPFFFRLNTNTQKNTNGLLTCFGFKATIPVFMKESKRLCRNSKHRCKATCRRRTRMFSVRFVSGN